MQKIFETYGTLLQANPLFHNLAPSGIPMVLTHLQATVKSYHKEAYVKSTGDKLDFIALLLTGEVHVLQDDYYGNRSITASISAGSLFAEAFACAGVPALPVDIVAAEDCTVMYLNSNILFHACDGSCQFYHIIIQNLLGIVARKNITLNQKLKYTSRKTTGEKLLSYLNDQAKAKKSNEFTIPFNRQELADYLGVERSAMSAEISKLVKLGILETQRSQFKLLKPEE